MPRLVKKNQGIQCGQKKKSKTMEKTKKSRKRKNTRDKGISTSVVVNSVGTGIIFHCDLPNSEIQSIPLIKRAFFYSCYSLHLIKNMNVFPCPSSTLLFYASIFIFHRNIFKYKNIKIPQDFPRGFTFTYCEEYFKIFTFFSFLTKKIR